MHFGNVKYQIERINQICEKLVHKITLTSFLGEERQNTLIFTIVSHSPLFHDPLSN